MTYDVYLSILTFIGFLSIVQERTTPRLMPTDKQSKIILAARDVFLRYGYKRTSMGDIGVAAGVSRPALYLVFKNKEEIFRAVFDDWVAQTIDEIERELAMRVSAREKLALIFELWAVRPFEIVLQSTEARELLECGYDFARASLEAGYARLDAVIVPVIAPLLQSRSRKARLSAESAARVLTGAVRGFKQVAATSGELRELIADLLSLSLDSVLAADAKGPRSALGS